MTTAVKHKQGATLADLIKESGRSPTAVAAALETTTTTIYRWSRGETEPTDSQAAELAQMLGVTRDRLTEALSGRRAPAARKSRR